MKNNDLRTRPRNNFMLNLRDFGRARAKNPPRKVFTRLRLQKHLSKCRPRLRTKIEVDPLEGYVV